MSEQWLYVGAAYALTWIVLAAYALRVSARVRRAEAAARSETEARP